jgi:succinate dehydrogenase / fumarate reductase cytochrome b subunit
LSTATALHEAPSATCGATHFLLRRLHSLTGILFGGYLVVHLLVNATLVQGYQHDIYQEQVDKIHSLPLLPAVEWIFIYLPILYHTIYGIWIVATGQPNVGNYNYGKNWAYFFQRVSAVILIGFIAFHVLAFKNAFGLAGRFAFDPEHATASAATHFGVSPWVTWVVYPIGILAGTFHLANGFWTAAITWGLTVSKHAQRRWGMVCIGLFVLTFGCGMTALVTSANTDPAKVPGSTTQPAGGYYPSKSGVQ